MFSAAPLPRPPQPTRPTLIVSLPAAWALRHHAQADRGRGRGLEEITARSGECLRAGWSVMVHSPGVGFEPESIERHVGCRPGSSRSARERGSRSQSASGLAFDDLRLEALEVVLLVQAAGRSGSRRTWRRCATRCSGGAAGPGRSIRGSEPRRAADRSRSASSSHEPPRAT